VQASNNVVSLLAIFSIFSFPTKRFPQSFQKSEETTHRRRRRHNKLYPAQAAFPLPPAALPFQTQYEFSSWRVRLGFSSFRALVTFLFVFIVNRLFILIVLLFLKEQNIEIRLN